MTSATQRIDVSVLMSVYAGDEAKWFDEALRSVLLEQTLKPAQLVLVIDGKLSPDLDAVISHYQSQYADVIDVVRLAKNQGLAHALNAGLSHCKYELVARMDADDISAPERLATQYDYFGAHEDLDILGTAAVDISAHGEEVGKRGVPTEHAELYKLMWTCPLIHPSVMFKKSKILAVGGYSETLKRRQDYELWFRCAEQGYQFANLPQALIRYRVTDDSLKRNSLSVAWNQYKIGLRGVSSLGLGFKARLGVAFPVIKALLPTPLRKLLIRLANMFDPRGRKHAQ